MLGLPPLGKKVERKLHNKTLKKAAAPFLCCWEWLHQGDSRSVEGTRTTLAAVHARSQALKHRDTSHGHLIRQLSAACCALSSLGRYLRFARTNQRVVEDLSRKSADVIGHKVKRVSNYLCKVKQALFPGRIALPDGATKELLRQRLQRTSTFVIGIATHGRGAGGNGS